MIRTYLVFVENEGAWTTAAQVQANDAEHAVRQAAANGDGGVYAAVPERNWTRLRVTLEPAKPRIRIEAQP
jgi:hypothetical protein